MPDFLNHYGDTEGPLGFPMNDKAAKELDALLRSLPDKDYRHVVIEKATTELSPGERADVSWISTESPDRQGEIVLAAGMDDTHFKNNPVVTLGHRYDLPPIGRSLWRRKVRDGQLRGVKAKTQYPARPAGWPEETWAPDAAFALVQAGLMTGKSIGFLTLKTHMPSDHEIAQRPFLKDVRRIVDEWLLLEYSCTWLPVNQDAVVEAVSKGAARILGLPERAAVVPFTPLEEIARALERRLKAIDPALLVQHAVEDGWARITGQV
ncbi:MAG TPA: hypothetical protein VE988_21870 [Gemmataceae bacterium]|nr:hypothetical protein [Gemmataceae bacterium]